MFIRLNQELLDLSTPKIMGILNLTQDSFYDGGRYNTADKALLQTEKLLSEGADIIDIGAQSTRPFAEEIGADEELKNLIPMIEVIRKEFAGIPISIDTYHAKVAEETIQMGAVLINDVSAGSLDEKMFEVIAQYQVPYVMMHMQGTPQNMQIDPQYEDVTIEVNHFFSKKINQLNALGVNDIILDPGFGFGKTIDHNYQLLKQLNLIGNGQCPILVGISRKSMIYKYLEISPEEALNGTTALHMAALLKGAHILRVHDVKAAKEVIQLFEKLK